MSDVENCPGCGVAPGQAHEEDCDHARCPDCAEQLLMHYFSEPAEDGCNPRSALWHGYDQQAWVARTLGWWTTAAGIDHLVEDYTRVMYAVSLGQVTWDRDTQAYTIGSIDEAMLDRALERS